MTDDRICLQCGESQAVIRASQRTKYPIYCAIVSWDGETEADWERHRFRDQSDGQLMTWGVLPEYWHLYRRVYSGWEIKEEHRTLELNL